MAKKKQEPAKSSQTTAAPPADAKPNKANKRRPIVKSGNAGINKSIDDRPVRTSIFGSWTGKTPLTLLNEHCQKQGWEKPIVDTRRNKQGFTGSVKLGKRNKKTGQVDTVTMVPPLSGVWTEVTTALEAKHVAATYCLHRINSHKSMHMTLPLPHRDFWREFDQLKNPKNAWQYCPDPFTAVPPVSSSAKQLQTAGQGTPTSSSSSSSRPMTPTSSVPNSWTNVPTIHMSRDHRMRVEKVIRKASLVYEKRVDSLSKSEREAIRRSMVALGFRPAHVDEAMQYSGSEDDALDWLCLHVPEDDLPAVFQATGEDDATLEAVHHTTKSLTRAWALKRMIALGYPETACDEALKAANDDEIRALEILQWHLAHTEPWQDATKSFDQDTLTTAREEEIEALDAIYGSHFTRTTDENGRIHLLVKSADMTLDVMVADKSQYPFALPIFSVVDKGLPTYLKLALLGGLVKEAEKHIGMPCVYMCFEWLEENGPHILAHPPLLREVTDTMINLAPSAPLPEKAPVPRSSRQSFPRGDSSSLLKELQSLHQSKGYEPMERARSNLPAHSFKETIIDTINRHPVTIVSGETGCGKTTQVPQFILDDGILRGQGVKYNIVCTQPRKVAALGVAERVAAERCESVGKTVGYAVRGDTRLGPTTRLQFCTTGVLLRRLQSDPNLKGVSHVIVDEVHERSVDSDFLLILLKRLLTQGRDIKIVLMSATVNRDLFSGYFGSAPMVDIPGFTHPVEDMYLEDVIQTLEYAPRLPMPKKDKKDEDTWMDMEQGYRDDGYDATTIQALARYRRQDKIDYDLITRTVAWIIEQRSASTALPDGRLPSILVFLPGAAEIRRCIDTLATVVQGELLPLHAQLSPAEQARVFRPSKKNQWRVVVATNVAETSITIDGVVYVIDTGRVKMTQFNTNDGMTHLIETWASRASCRQRRGRAGRTRPGLCIKLFTRHREKAMPADTLPEMLRTPLAQMCLQIKSMGVSDVVGFLSQAIEPPSVDAMDHALQVLEALDAVTPRGEMTPLGKHMASIPTDLRISKMLLFGAILQCVEPILTIAAIMSLKSPFVSPMDRREEAQRVRSSFACDQSDWLTDWHAYDAWVEARKQGVGMRAWCEEHMMSLTTLNEIRALRRQYKEAIEALGFLPSGVDLNAQSRNTSVIKAVIFAGLHPNLARVRLPSSKYDKLISGTMEREKEARDIKFYTPQGRVFLHPGSVLFGDTTLASPFVTYLTCATTTKTFLRDATEISCWAVLFFGGHIRVDHHHRGLVAGHQGWAKLRAWARIGVLVNHLKRLLQALLEDKIAQPSLDISSTEVVQAMLALVTQGTA